MPGSEPRFWYLAPGLKAGGGLVVTAGERRAQLYALASAPVRRSAPPVRRLTAKTECASAPPLIESGAQRTGGEPTEVGGECAAGEEASGARI